MKISPEACDSCPKAIGCDPKKPLCPIGRGDEVSFEKAQQEEHHLKGKVDQRVDDENHWGEQDGSQGQPPCEDGSTGRKLPKRPR